EPVFPPAAALLTLNLFREDPEEAARRLLRELGGSALCDLSEAIDRVIDETPKGHPKRIVEKFGDTKWHSLPVIAKHLDAPADEVERSLAGMVKDGRGDAKTETKKVGTVKHYRFYKNERMVSSIELIEKLTPIVEGLETEGRKNMVTMSVMTVAV